MLAVASNLFGKSSSLAAYNLHQSGPSTSASSASSPGPSSSPFSTTISKSFSVGLWKVLGATHKTTGKDVSVWVFEKKILDGVKMDGAGRSAQQAREWVLEQLKKEVSLFIQRRFRSLSLRQLTASIAEHQSFVPIQASSLSRLRHPDILHMVEPLEDTRSELTFVTELVTSSLGNILSAASGPTRRMNGSRPPGVDATGEVDLDEVEIQKGVLQIAKGLGFLHQQAKMVHLNLSPDAILVNAKVSLPSSYHSERPPQEASETDAAFFDPLLSQGDWKLSGLNLTTPLVQPGGTATKYIYPEIEPRLPPQVQWKLDYLGELS